MTMIALEMIDTPAWNSRLPKTGKGAKDEQAKIEALAQSLTADGQLTAIEVEQKTDGRYELIFGTRRCAAARVNKWTQINAEVRAPSAASDKIYRNIIENAQRENLTPFELARAAAQLKDLGLKNPEIAAKIGKSATHVSNLHTAYNGLPKPVLKDWQDGSPAATEQRLCSIARDYKTDEDKVKAWDAAVAEQTEKEAAGQKPGKRGKNKKGEASGSTGLPVSQKRLAYLIEALSSKKGSPELDDDGRKWSKALLDFVIQGREHPPAGIPRMPVKEKKAPKDE